MSYSSLETNNLTDNNTNNLNAFSVIKEFLKVKIHDKLYPLGTYSYREKYILDFYQNFITEQHKKRLEFETILSAQQNDGSIKMSVETLEILKANNYDITNCDNLKFNILARDYLLFNGNNSIYYNINGLEKYLMNELSFSDRDQLVEYCTMKNCII